MAHEIEVVEYTGSVLHVVPGALDRLVSSGMLDLPKPGLLYRAHTILSFETSTGSCQ